MAATPPDPDAQTPKTTLGDLLYRDKGKAPVPEKDWIALVQRIATGDQVALHVLYQQTHRIVFTLIVRITGNRETAEELTVDVFHDVWRRASSYRPDGGSVLGWMMNQARSRAIDRVRFEQRKKRVNRDGDGLGEATQTDGPQESLDAKEQARLLRHALAALTPQERQAIETAYFGELTYADVASRLDQPLGTVKTRIRAGLGKLRHLLADTLKRL